MQQHTTNAARMTVGLDVGDRYTYLCVLDAAGEVVEEGRIPSTSAALRRRFPSAERMRIVLETGTHSPWISRVLTELGHEVLVANARRLRLIAEHDAKSDRVDAETLARLGRADPRLLAPIRHRAAGTQADLAVVRGRDALVRVRTVLVNHVRGAVKSVGGRLPKCSTHSFPRQVGAVIPDELGPALGGILTTIDEVSRAIRTYDRRLAELCTAYPETGSLQQVPGVGPVTALCYVLTLEDPARFPRSRAVGSYLGLRPKQEDSGRSAPQLRITKAGDQMLRRLLVGSAHYILGPFGPECDLRQWGLRVAARGGKNAKKRAVVAVARKLAVLLHRLWVTGDVYEPLRRAAAFEEAVMATA